MLIPVITKVIENIYETNPRDWKNKSETKLPWKPRMFFISVFEGKIKFGSSGEYDVRANRSSTPELKIMIPKISASLLIVKLINKLAVFLISIFESI